MASTLRFPGLTEARKQRLKATSKENKERLIEYRVKRIVVDLENSEDVLHWKAFNRIQTLQRWLERRYA